MNWEQYDDQRGKLRDAVTEERAHIREQLRQLLDSDRIKANLTRHEKALILACVDTGRGKPRFPLRFET